MVQPSEGIADPARHPAPEPHRNSSLQAPALAAAKCLVCLVCRYRKANGTVGEGAMPPATALQHAGRMGP
jgi:hypothetical protein